MRCNPKLPAHINEIKIKENITIPIIVLSLSAGSKKFNGHFIHHRNILN